MLHFHADDFGMTDASAARILDGFRSGGLNGISILPNGPAVPPSLPEGSLYSIHLNLVEGKALSRPADIPLLADENGYFRYSFEGLLLHSLTGKNSSFAAQLRAELRLQMENAVRYIPSGCTLGLDSHQHTHMIPLIFNTVLELINELHLPVSYLRIPVEPLTPFLRHPSLYGTYRPINFVKNMVLRTLFVFSRSAYRRCGIPTQVFFGLMLSGRMDERRVRLLLPDFQRIAKKRNTGLEVLFHPGAIKDARDCMSPDKKDFVNFYRSAGRDEEYEAVVSFGREFQNNR